MSKYPLDDNVLQEEYEALLIKLALKEYAAEQSEALMRENMEVPQTQPKQKDRVIAAAFRQAAWEDTRSRVAHGMGKRLPGWRWCFWRRHYLSLLLLQSPRRSGRLSTD